MEDKLDITKLYGMVEAINSEGTRSSFGMLAQAIVRLETLINELMARLEAAEDDISILNSEAADEVDDEEEEEKE